MTLSTSQASSMIQRRFASKRKMAVVRPPSRKLLFESLELRTLLSGSPTIGNLTTGVLGDINDDSELNAQDIDLLNTEIGQPPDDKTDLNSDNVVDEEDVRFLVRTILNTEFGDVNLDGKINNLDFGFVLGSFDVAGLGWDGGDVNGDGKTGNGDFGVVLGNFGFMAAPRPLFAVTIVDPTDVFAGRRDELESNILAAAGMWARNLVSDATIEIEVTPNLAIPRCTGRSETSSFVHSSGNFNVFEQGVAAELRTGVDPNGAEPDVEIQCAQDYVFDELWFDPSPALRSVPVDPSRTDAVTVFLHELGHAIAFNGWIDGTAGQYPPPMDFQSTFDELTFFDGTNFFFTGPLARQLYGQDVPITFGNPFHLGNNAPRPGADLIPELMNGVVFNRGQRYQISALELAIIEDTGVPLRST